MPTTTKQRDRFPIAAVYAVLFLLGVALAVWEAFLVPLRLPGGTEGLAVVLAFGGNLAVGVGAARAVRTVPAAAMSGIGWLVAVLVLSSVARPADEVVIPSKLATDPGVGTVGTLLLFAGALGTTIAVVLANRMPRTDAAERMQPPVA
jgi:hypothetical protein